MGSIRPPRLHHIEVVPAMRGSIVHVGCQKVVFTDAERAVMAAEISDYITDPDGTTKRYGDAFPDFLGMNAVPTGYPVEVAADSPAEPPAAPPL